MNMKHILQLAMLTCLSLTTAWAQVDKSDFNELGLTPNSYWNGSTSGPIKGFASGDAFFVNSYNVDWGYWDGGFAYSNTTDVTTAGYTNDFSAITGKDYSGDGIYAPAQRGAIVRLTGAAVNTTVTGFYLTNSTYATLSMKNGDTFAKKFGGVTGNDPDYFKLIVTGYSGGIAGATIVEAYLADFRNSDNSFDYILQNWRWVDLRPLGNIDSVFFSMESSDNDPDFGMNTPAYFVIDEFNAPLFSPRSDKVGSTDISKTSTSFVNWASGCTVTRGHQDISTPSSALASVGADLNATGASDATVVSLGDSGIAVLTFPHSITNGTGADFAVFENAFTNSNAGSLSFAELAFVEVSSDGVNYFRFPAVSNTDPTVQTGGFAYTDPQLLHNLAGAALFGYGTPFDLEELSGTAGLDTDKITHVRIIDAIGSIDTAYASKDKNGNAVNDPWKTAFGSCGFDLEAVGVLHENSITGVISSTKKAATISIYPNPAADVVNVSFLKNNSEGVLQLLDITGNPLVSQEIVSGTETTSLELSNLKQGVYILLFNGEAQQFVKN